MTERWLVSFLSVFQILFSISVYLSILVFKVKSRLIPPTFLKNVYLFIYLFMYLAVPGLSCGNEGCLVVACMQDLVP